MNHIETRSKIRSLFSVWINYPFASGAWGGGNQFLKALRARFDVLGKVAPSLEKADVVLLNGNPGSTGTQIRLLFSLFRKKSEAITVIRMDGPIRLIRKDGGQADAYLYALIRAVADGVIFQSQWSRERNKAFGLQPAPFETVIGNAPDAALFFPGEAAGSSDRTRLIATSWSANPEKGFALYSWLDEHLDFERFSFTFVGNSPLAFNRIRCVPPCDSRELGALLREHDVYITASRNDPCSNALIEALHCGLPAVFNKDGGHPEIVGDGGEGFTGTDDVLEALERVSADIAGYRSRIVIPGLEAVADAYLDFFESLLQARQNGYIPKRLKVWTCFGLLAHIAMRVAKNRLKKLFRRA